MIDSRISGARIEMPGLNNGNFAPRGQLRRRHVLPGLAGISRNVDQAVVGPRPDGVGFLEGRSHGVNYPAVLPLLRVGRGKNSQIRRCLIGFPRQIGTNDRPTFPASSVLNKTLAAKKSS